MGKYKTKVIQANLGILTHIPTYSEPCVTLRYSEPLQIQNQMRIQNLSRFRALVCSKPWHILNQRYIDDPDIFRTQTYLEPKYIQSPKAFCGNS